MRKGSIIVLCALAVFCLPGAELQAQDITNKIGGTAADDTFQVTDSNDTVLMEVQADGMVGIGTTSQNEKLDVAGNIDLNGSYRVRNMADPLTGTDAATRSYVDARGITVSYDAGTSLVDLPPLSVGQTAIITGYYHYDNTSAPPNLKFDAIQLNDDSGTNYWWRMNNYYFNSSSENVYVSGSKDDRIRLTVNGYGVYIEFRITITRGYHRTMVEAVVSDLNATGITDRSVLTKVYACHHNPSNMDGGVRFLAENGGILEVDFVTVSVLPSI